MSITLDKIKKDNKRKEVINSITSTYFNIDDVLDGFVTAEGVSTAITYLKEYLKEYGFVLIPAYPKLSNRDIVDNRFFIIRDVSIFNRSSKTKNLRLFAPSNNIGKLVGNNGFNIGLITNYLNELFVDIEYQNPTIVNIEERPLNNCYASLKSSLLEIVRLAHINS